MVSIKYKGNMNNSVLQSSCLFQNISIFIKCFAFYVQVYSILIGFIMICLGCRRFLEQKSILFWLTYLIQFFVFVFWQYSGLIFVPGNQFWQDSGTIGVPEIDSGHLHARQALCPLSYLLGSLVTFFSPV